MIIPISQSSQSKRPRPDTSSQPTRRAFWPLFATPYIFIYARDDLGTRPTVPRISTRQRQQRERYHGAIQKARQDHLPAPIALLERFPRPCRQNDRRHSSHVFYSRSNIRSLAAVARESRGHCHWLMVYLYGSVLAPGHLAFVPLVAGPIEDHGRREI